ncbi:MAG: nitroreductase family protein [Solobacterium sp.]|nr:nitroreductase family protein [Erysipelotrichaceae bacterium]MBQ1325854.1 nitroreductase family protein [Solobacterium sp.]MBQ1382908.1 nitroreductase family protein [Solobacterium sp.]MBQ1447435.1 nitroreductase family protein [Solobacterium sp.]MBQ2689988.1 nitroreductase family protein [Solobacterium sp.]
MTLKDLVIKNRSFRAYDESFKFTEDDMREFVELCRYCATSGNQQALKFYIAWERDEVDAIAKCTHWGKDRPYPGINPSGFIVILQDNDIDKRAWAWWRDAGIAAQTILLRAAERGLGGLMIGSFDKKPLRDVTKLADNLKILLVVAIGKPTEGSVLEDMGEDGSTLPYRDENGVTHVRKRLLDDLIVKRG